MTDSPIGFEGIDMTDPRQSLAWALGSMPSHQTGGLPIAIPPKAIPAWSAFLNDLGIEYNPEKQKLFPIASAQPGMGWLSPVRWVSRDEFDKHQAEKKAKAEGLDLSQVLAAVNPELAQKLANMTDVERREEMASQAAKVGDLGERLQQMRKTLAEQNGTEA